MAKKSKTTAPKRTEGPASDAKAKGGHKTPDRQRRRHLPNWPVLALALAGMALTGYLSVTDWLGGQPLACGAGSSCEVVQDSRWGTLLGLPIAFWGFLTYAAIGHVAFRVKRAVLHWHLVWLLSLVGLGISVYLTAIALVVIDATCGYCLASLALMAAIFAVALAQSPRGEPGFSLPTWVLESGTIALVAVVVLHLHYSGVFSPAAGPEDPYLKALAEHLSRTDAAFYGAQWCGACQAQKEMFEPSAGRLPYVECSPNGRNAPRAPVCVEQNVSSYPTWIISGERHTGVLPPEELARLSNFTW